MMIESTITERLNEHLEEVRKRHPDIIKRAMFISPLGSVNYGLNTPESDVDSVIVTIPSVDSLLEYKNRKNYIELPNHEFCTVWEINQYLDLLIRQNPTVLETLFSQFLSIQDYTPIVHELIAIRDDVARYDQATAFKAMYGIFRTEFRRLAVNTDNDNVFYKAAYHCLRVLYMMRHYCDGYKYYQCMHFPIDEAQEALAYKNAERGKSDIFLTLRRAADSLERHSESIIARLTDTTDTKRSKKVVDTFNRIKLECINRTVKAYGKDYGFYA